MQSDKSIKITAVLAIMVMAATLLAVPQSDADQEYTRDYGSFYSYTLQFVFDGSEAQSIDWDFGDGSEHSTEWNPKHTYQAKGTYYVTQTTTNTQGSTTEVYKVTVLGFPKIHFDPEGGSHVDDIQMQSYNAIATEPEHPVRSGYSFGGWYYDAECTQAMDWTAGIVKDLTLHAKWTADPTPVQTYTVTFDSAGGSAVQSRTVNSGSAVSEPAAPVRSGYTFDGWFLGSTEYDFASQVTQNITLLAHWTEVPAPVINRIVTFDVAGG